jgi:hypothetical protein
MAVHGEDVDEDEKAAMASTSRSAVKAVGEGVKQARAHADRGQRRDKRHAQSAASGCVETAQTDHRRDDEGEVRHGVQRLGPEPRAQPLTIGVNWIENGLVHALFESRFPANRSFPSVNNAKIF